MNCTVSRNAIFKLWFTFVFIFGIEIIGIGPTLTYLTAIICSLVAQRTQQNAIILFINAINAFANIAPERVFFEALRAMKIAI
jgi:fumarate reductase subunit C